MWSASAPARSRRRKRCPSEAEDKNKRKPAAVRFAPLSVFCGDGKWGNGRGRNPAPTHGLGVRCVGGTDCHVATLLAMTGFLWRCGALSAGRRGNRRSAAGGGRSEPVSRKCPDWRPRQWAGIGWHDGGQSPTPTKALQRVRCVGSTVCRTGDVGHRFAMTFFCSI